MREHKLEWTRLIIHGTDQWRSGCRLSLFHKRKQLPQRTVVDAFVPMCSFIEPVQDLDSRPPYSGIVRSNWAAVCVDVEQFNLFGHLPPVGTYSLCRDIVAVGPVVDIEAEPTRFLVFFDEDDMTTTDITLIDLPFTEPTEAIPQLSIPAAAVPTTDYRDSFAQLRATVDKIH
ncbi:pentatricopeptide repeat-containing protein chloroplastic [Dorcoceras hygrometricum]|uniref:Pentatricopeptide repeat-containing protein chloroplastic n=1 Tax=Dorcoceras hygrometricum TaxID=472368 RepID=A0A2Z6ZY57_9LAMI|nr:pentatricopeptide repeat-containing protein chloroplastic [Dorcoceras hygrometricum]